MLIRTMFATLRLSAGAALVQPAKAQEAVTLKLGTGQDVTSVRCSACHTLNYIRMNSPFLSQAAWTAEVGKMRKVFGASIEDAEAERIIAYLAAQYGEPGK